MRRASRNSTGSFGIAAQWTPVWTVSNIPNISPVSHLKSILGLPAVIRVHKEARGIWLPPFWQPPSIIQEHYPFRGQLRVCSETLSPSFHNWDHILCSHTSWVMITNPNPKSMIQRFSYIFCIAVHNVHNTYITCSVRLYIVCPETRIETHWNAPWSCWGNHKPCHVSEDVLGIVVRITTG